MSWVRTFENDIKYKVESGDNLSKIAQKWLGNANRYMEIYNLQPESWKASHNHNPNFIKAAESILMPQDAINRALTMGVVPGGGAPAAEPPSQVYTIPEIVIYGDPTPDDPPPRAPTTPTLPASSSDAPSPDEPDREEGGIPLYAWLGLGGVAVAGAAYLLMRKPKPGTKGKARPHPAPRRRLLRAAARRRRR